MLKKRESPQKAYERIKKWRQENKEKHRQQWLRAWAKNSEKILAKRKEKRANQATESN
jgi:hypothetical protein